MKDCKVLLVDDEEEFASALAERLNLRGIATSMTCSGEDALKIIEADPPSVIVMDMMMPGLSGQELLARIRSNHPQIGVVLLTGHGSAEVIGQVPPSCKCLIKPVKIEQLIETIRLAGKIDMNSS